MKQFFVSLNGTSAIESHEPSADLKSSLDAVFAAKHGGIGARLTPREIPVTPVAKVIPLYQQTWARVAAGVILVAGVFSIWQLTGNSDFETKDVALAKAEEKSEMAITESETQFKVSQSQPEEASVPGRKEKRPVAPVQRDQDESEKIVMYDYVKAYSPYADKASIKTLGEAALAEAENVAFSKMKNGIDADLYPDGRKDSEEYSNKNASAVSASREDLLSYIVPAF